MAGEKGMNKGLPPLILAVVLVMTFGGCVHVVPLRLEPDVTSNGMIPLTVRTTVQDLDAPEIGRFISMDLKTAIASYMAKRRTFRQDGPADSELNIAPRFMLIQGGNSVTLTFLLKAYLTGGAGQIGPYVGEATVKPGIFHLSSPAERNPVNKVLNQALDNLFAQIEMDKARILSRLQGTPQTVAARAPEAVEPAPVSSVDVPTYRLAERVNDFAVVVGIGKYSDIPEAQFAERDAEAVKDHLMAAGLPSRNVVHLASEKAGYKGIEKFVEVWLPNNVRESSRVFFYFSGHGAPDPKTGEAYLVPWDGDPNYLANTGYPIKRLYEKLSSLKAKEVIVAMDACFSGAGGRSVLAKGARPLVMKVDDASVPQNLTVFAAASGEQITSTMEDQGHGTFTYYFLKGLSGGAKDSSGAVTAKGLYDYLKPKVQDAARRQNRDQEPVLHGSSDKELVKF